MGPEGDVPQRGDSGELSDASRHPKFFTIAERLPLVANSV